MTSPRLPSKKGDRRSDRLVYDIILFVVSASVFATLLSIFGPTRHLLDQHHAIATEQRIPGPKPFIPIASLPKIEALDIEADVEELDHEEMFQATVKSCLPGNEKKKQNCRQIIPDPKGDDKKKVQRVAIIAPPGDLSSSLLRVVEQVVHHHNHRQNKVELDIEVIETSHVPPYGYGKTHGLSKVLRLAPEPLVLEVTDTLQYLLQPGESITLADITAGLRQIMRFHCRLSHLAAHTAILSVSFTEMLTEPADVMEKLQAFLVPKDVPEKAELSDDLVAPDDDQNGLFEAQEAYGTQILSRIQQLSKVDVNKKLDEVLLEELKQTNNMTKWPCQSFWTSGEPADPTKLSPLVQRLAKALSPNCDDPYANCFVERDKCEARGDGLCKKKDSL
jgi:hypothetical protein